MDKTMIEKSFEDNKAPIEILMEVNAPQVTRYKVKPGWYPYASKRATPKRVPVSTIKRSLANVEADLEIEGLRITQNGALWLEVPTDSRRTIKPSDVTCATGELPVRLGIDVSNDSLCVDLRKTPHLLIAGATGSGKSVCVNAILTDLISTKTAEELQLILIDPKFVELSSYKGIAHLAMPIVNDAQQAKAALQYAVNEMDKRYVQMEKAGTRDMKSLDMAYLVIVIDEYADIVTSQIEYLVQRLAQKGRAAGVHLIIATQRPSVDVITGVIKANFPTRICFSVLSRIDSKVVLDTDGAEKLLGQGDGLFLHGAKVMRFQGVYLSDREIDTIADANKASHNTAGSPNLFKALLVLPLLPVTFITAVLGLESKWADELLGN